MIHRIENGPKINLTFNNGTARVSVGGQGSMESLLVKWFCDDVFVGEMNLPKSTWGCYNNYDVSHWVIEFWHNDELVSTYDHKLLNKPVLVLANFQKSTPGKPLSFSELHEYVARLKRDYKCEVHVYFEGSEKYDFSESEFTPLRMNLEIAEFRIITEKTFNG
jgi:hypothetical protein